MFLCCPGDRWSKQSLSTCPNKDSESKDSERSGFIEEESGTATDTNLMIMREPAGISPGWEICRILTCPVSAYQQAKSHKPDERSVAYEGLTRLWKRTTTGGMCEDSGGRSLVSNYPVRGKNGQVKENRISRRNGIWSRSGTYYPGRDAPDRRNIFVREYCGWISNCRRQR